VSDDWFGVVFYTAGAWLVILLVLTLLKLAGRL
jgi:hypothetical protein